MDVSSVSRQYTQPVQSSDDAQQAQNRAVRQQQEAAAKKTEQAQSKPVVNGQGQTIGSLVNTTA
jgi:hypothetical protein